ncbi:hypothetical protein ACQPT2_21085 [Erwinia amylovora]
MTDPMTTMRKYGARLLTFTQNTSDLRQYRQPTDARFPAGRIRRALSAYGWRGKRLNDEVRRITRGPFTEWGTTGQQDGARVVYPYGWGQQELTREMRRMFPRNTRSVRFFTTDELVSDLYDLSATAVDATESPKDSGQGERHF